MERIIFFDGVCNFCHGSIQFIIRRDHDKKFRYASLQGKTAQEKLPPELTSDLNTMVFLRDGKIYKNSSAGLMVASDLPAPWSFLGLFLVIPKFVRDAVYGLIVKNRYNWFGKKDSCPLPSPDQRELFLD